LGESVKKHPEKKMVCTTCATEKNGIVTATKSGTTNEFFVASTKHFAAATKRFVDRTKHFVVVIFAIPILTNDCCMLVLQNLFFSVRNLTFCCCN